MQELISNKRNRSISLSKFEKRVINLFDFWDHLDVHGYRKYLTSKPSAFQPYFERYQCKTTAEKLQAMKFAKYEKTKCLIRSKLRNNGKICPRLARVQYKSPCGFLRLFVAYFHKVPAPEQVVKAAPDYNSTARLVSSDSHTHQASASIPEK